MSTVFLHHDPRKTNYLLILVSNLSLKFEIQVKNEKISYIQVNQCYIIEPTNIQRKNIIRDGAWVKSTWTEVREFLHNAFKIYNRSGQHDSIGQGDWASPQEQARWKRAALTNNLRFPSAIAYAISVLEEGNFEHMGREMPPGTGIDNSIEEEGVNDASASKSNKRRASSEIPNRGNYAKKTKSGPGEDDNLVRVMEETRNVDTQLRAFEL